MVSARDYAEKFKEKPDQQTSLGIIASIAQAGHDWTEQSAKLRGEGKSTEELAKAAEALALKSVADEKVFLDKAGTKPIVDAYVKDLISRSKKKDEEQGKPEGTNLIAYLDKTAAAVNKEYPGQKFDEMKEKAAKAFESGEPSFIDKIRLSSDLDKFQNIRKDVHNASAEHIGTGGRLVEEDFLHTLRENTKAQPEIKAQPDATKKKNPFDVELTTDKLPEKGTGSPDFMDAISKLLEAILGFDIIGMFNGKGKEEKKEEVAKAEAPKPATVETAAGKANDGGTINPDSPVNQDRVAAFLKANAPKEKDGQGVDGTQQKPDTFIPTAISFKLPVSKESGSSRT